MLKVKYLVLAVCLLFLNNMALAEKLDPSCLLSYNVKDIMINDFSNLEGPKSCVTLERVKTQIYTKTISPLIKDPTKEKIHKLLVEKLTDAETAIEEIQKELTANSSKKSEAEKQLIRNIMLRQVAIGTGIYTCAQSLGAGCALGAILAYYAEISMIESAKSTSDLKVSAEKMLKQIAKDKIKLKEAREELPTGFSQGIKEFNKFCYLIRTSCL